MEAQSDAEFSERLVIQVRPTLKERLTREAARRARYGPANLSMLVREILEQWAERQDGAAVA